MQRKHSHTCVLIFLLHLVFFFFKFTVLIDTFAVIPGINRPLHPLHKVLFIDGFLGARKQNKDLDNVIFKKLLSYIFNCNFFPMLIMLAPYKAEICGQFGISFETITDA